MSRRQPTRMSLDQTLEQERRELVGSADGRHTRHIQSGSWAAPPRNNQAARNTTMVDFSPTPGALPPRHGSIAGIGVGVTPPSHRRTWNEPISSSPLRLSSSAASSSPSPSPPVEGQEKEKSEAVSRRSSDGTDRPYEKKKPVGKVEKSGVKTSTAAFNCPQFNVPVQDTPKRPTVTTTNISPPPPTSTGQAQEGPSTGKNTVAAMMSGLDLKVGLPGFARGRDSVRRSSSRGSSLDSRYPSRLGRSVSPRKHWLSSNPLSLTTSSLKSNKLITDKSKMIDMDHGDKHLADNTASSKTAGSLTTLPKPGSRRGSSDGGAVSPGDERLEKDMYDSENNPIAGSSDEEDDESSSDDESVGRGRKVSIDIVSPSEEDEGTGDANKEKPESLLTTEGEESQLVEDKIDSTPHEEEPKHTLIHSAKLGPQPIKPAQVHPRTSYESTSAVNTPFGSDDEAELSDIKRAQKLSIQMSSINNSVHNRSIRTIVRGNYANVQDETEGGRHRRRRYMVTTDLSEESVYALEWTIGTILRDGDTMFAVCAFHEEASTGSSVQVGDGAKAMQDAAMVVGSQTEETAQRSQLDQSTYLPRALLSRLGPGTDSKPSSVDSKGMSKAESERVRAVETISQTCVRLLRKTMLQVRIAVEVIHCKSPKHMITEAIDGLAPTLVIVGARGRSALKGVLLGSFSNYLVTHSSVPVMVARRKLKQTKTKKTRTNIRLSNNLMTPKSLAMAKVD